MFVFFADGSETWMVYHAVDIPDDGSWGYRTARVQRIEWSADNFPIFPRPSGLSVPLDTPSGQDP
jgi:GH43 family beta-xylosidase